MVSIPPTPLASIPGPCTLPSPTLALPRCLLDKEEHPTGCSCALGFSTPAHSPHPSRGSSPPHPRPARIAGSCSCVRRSGLQEGPVSCLRAVPRGPLVLARFPAVGGVSPDSGTTECHGPRRSRRRAGLGARGWRQASGCARAFPAWPATFPAWPAGGPLCAGRGPYRLSI